MRFDVITLFPELFAPFKSAGINRRAFESGAVELNLWQLRDYAEGTYRRVDVRPFGGGPGMVMLIKPLEDTLAAIRNSHHKAQISSGPVCLLSPQGKVFSQKLATDMLKYSNLTLICGRYEAVDQRFIDRNIDFELSIGDFVLSGGEIPAMAIMDAMIRLIPGVLGDENSALQDSFVNGLLDHPHYTRPEIYENLCVPDVLLGGHHAKILDWRRQRSLELTLKRRPDLIEAARAKGLLNQDDELFLKKLSL